MHRTLPSYEMSNLAFDVITAIRRERDQLMNSSQNKNHAVTRRWRLKPSDVLRPEEFQQMVKLAMGKAKVSRKQRWKQRDLAILLLAGQQGLRVGEILG